MKIELLYFEGCPSWQTALENVRSALRMEGQDVPVELVQVVDNEDAAQRRFLGSPSFRINGVERRLSCGIKNMIQETLSNKISFVINLLRQKNRLVRQ